MDVRNVDKVVGYLLLVHHHLIGDEGLLAHSTPALAAYSVHLLAMCRLLNAMLRRAMPARWAHHRGALGGGVGGVAVGFVH